MGSHADVTYFTVSDERFFPGTVALLNSLRLTGNDDPLVVLDVGLREAQRARLEDHARVVPRPDGLLRPHFKAFPLRLDPRGVVVIIDSDMIVTRSLRSIIDLAESGRICVFPDHVSQTNRWFEEWESVFQLKSPLRRQTYVNSGFIAFSTEHWPDFLSRYWEVSDRVPLDAVHVGTDMNTNPFWTADQDSLNALLMSEIPPDRVEVMPSDEEVHPNDLVNTRIIDTDTLECRLFGDRPVLLHYSMAPKAWERRGWIRVRRDVYVRLFGRVVCGDDVVLRMDPGDLPLWLRPDLAGTIALTLLDLVHGIAAAIRRLLPDRASAAVWRAAHRFSAPRRR